jgi:hypothetical protein
MTKLSKPVSRETLATRFDRGHRNVIVTLRPPNRVCFRLKGLRKEYDLPADTLYGTCQMAEIRTIAKDKMRAKKGKRA